MTIRGPYPAPDHLLVGFGFALRHAGLAVTADRVQIFLRAVAALDAGVAGALLLVPARGHPPQQCIISRCAAA